MSILLNTDFVTHHAHLSCISRERLPKLSHESGGFFLCAEVAYAESPVRLIVSDIALILRKTGADIALLQPRLVAGGAHVVVREHLYSIANVAYTLLLLLLE